MWTSVYMTQDINTAQSMREKMEDSNILVMMRSIKLEERPSEDCFEILVPSAELKDALEIIITD